MTESTLQVPEKVTIRWLINHCPFQLWSVLTGILISSFGTGYAWGQANRTVTPQLQVQVGALTQGHNDRLNRLELRLAKLREDLIPTSCTPGSDGYYCVQLFTGIEAVVKDIERENASFRDALRTLASAF